MDNRLEIKIPIGTYDIKISTNNTLYGEIGDSYLEFPLPEGNWFIVYEDNEGRVILIK